MANCCCAGRMSCRRTNFQQALHTSGTIRSGAIRLSPPVNSAAACRDPSSSQTISARRWRQRRGSPLVASSRTTSSAMCAPVWVMARIWPVPPPALRVGCGRPHSERDVVCFKRAACPAARSLAIAVRYPRCSDQHLSHGEGPYDSVNAIVLVRSASRQIPRRFSPAPIRNFCPRPPPGYSATPTTPPDRGRRPRRTSRRPPFRRL